MAGTKHTAGDPIIDHGLFLLDRLEEFERELLDDEVARQFLGHVAPAIARLRSAIAKAESKRVSMPDQEVECPECDGQGLMSGYDCDCPACDGSGNALPRAKGH